MGLRVPLTDIKRRKTRLISSIAPWLFVPNPRKCKISREWDRLTDQNALYMYGSHVKLRYTPSGRQGQSRKPVNIGFITAFSDRL